MELTRFEISRDFGNYSKPAKLTAEATFAGPFGNLSVKLSDNVLVKIVELISDEASNVARKNAEDVYMACGEAQNQVLALTHEAEATE